MDFPHLIILQFAILVVLSSYKSIMSLGSAQSTTTPNIETDREALISFKSQLSMEPPDALPSWDHNSSPCNWSGVVCSRERVIGLDLSGLGLTGSISPHIGNLSFLTSLQLQNNRFTGTLPDQLGNLFRLQVLNTSFNAVQGPIPRNISRCTNLRILDLMQNEISGRIPEELTRLAALQVLNLARNHLSGAIPPSIGNLSSLTVLNLGTNTLGGMIPSDIANLLNLENLDVNINNLTGNIPPSIYNMSSLVSLAVASNNLSGEIPGNIGVTLPNLLVFNFCINKFTGTIPGSLHNLTNIRIIRMAHNLLHGTVPPGLGNLPELEMYNIGFNNIISSGDDGLGFLTYLTNSTRLDFLAIDGNLLGGVIPESIGNLSKVLANLYMGGNRISGSIPASIGQLSGLALLNLSHNALSGEIPTEIGQLEDLQMLGLALNGLSGNIPNSLGNLQRLNEIDLSGNVLVGSIPTNFASFQNLLSMDLSNNKLNGSIPEEILNLRSLSTFLNLSKNLLTGPLPREIGQLENVATIDLSNNGFSGSIPDSIGDCTSLEELFMANNMFTGPIPDTLDTLKGLETLDLSSNQLIGSVPHGLQNLLALQFLNLSFNNLEGEIPISGVFANLSNVHMEGNSRLCLNLACDNGRSHGRLILLSITTTVAAIVALCFAVGLFFYVRKSKAKIIAERSESFKGEHQMVTYDELRLATENFNQGNLIGQGSFGSVYKGYLREGFAVAVKVLDIERTGFWKSFLAECAALRHVRHRNLVKLITSCSSIDFRNMEFIALVYDFMSNGSLEDWINGKRMNENGEGLNVLDRLKIAIDVACALNYLHHECEAPVVHCDLKPSNVLLDKDMTAKIGDFGLARLLIERIGDQPSISSTHALKGSIGYIPPEYGMGAKPSTAGDVYSFGMMLLELFTGKSPTHESFVGGLNLKSWVQAAFPNDVDQVVDPNLQNSGHDGESTGPEMQLGCIVSVIGVGLSCTAESVDGRISVRDALRKLKSVRDSLIKPDITLELKY